jgi:hypothetical protein
MSTYARLFQPAGRVLIAWVLCCAALTAQAQVGGIKPGGGHQI